MKSTGNPEQEVEPASVSGDFFPNLFKELEPGLAPVPHPQERSAGSLTSPSAARGIVQMFGNA